MEVVEGINEEQLKQDGVDQRNYKYTSSGSSKGNKRVNANTSGLGEVGSRSRTNSTSQDK